MGCSGSKDGVAAPGGVAARDDGADSGGRDKGNEDKVEVAMKMKRRYQNVFSDSVDVSAAPIAVTAAMSKTPAQTALITEALQHNFVFEALGEAETAKIVEFMALRAVPAGTALIEQGDEGTFFFVVEEGTFEFVVDGEVKGACAAGGSFGELALLYGAPRAATVRATRDAEVWALDRATFRVTVASGAARQRARVAEALASVDVLQGLTEGQLGDLADAVQVVKYAAGHLIIEKETTGNVFYMITDGEVECTDVGQANQFKNLVLRRGEYFGERALLMDQLRAANVVSKTDVTLLALDREAFQRTLGPLRRLLDDNLNLRVLNSVPILHQLTPAEREKVVPLFFEKRFESGETIISQGEPGVEFFVVKSGSCDVLVEVDGVKRAKASVFAGEYFGEVALVSDEPRGASVIATEAVECFVLSRLDFEKSLGSIAEMVARVAAKLKVNALASAEKTALSKTQVADYKVVASLGSGTFGRVKLVVAKSAADKAYALKTMHKSEVVAHRQVANVIREKQLMLDVDHPFILRLYAAFQDAHRIYLLLEFVQGGELFSVLHTATHDGVAEPNAMFYAAGVAMALEALHDKRIAYRDLKPENIMVDAQGYPKVVDFGFAKVVQRKTFTLCGTPEYLAPEIVAGRGHTTAVDWWAFGILVYEMLAGYSPFADLDHGDPVQIFKNIHSARLAFPKHFPCQAADLIKASLDRNPQQRLCSGKSATDAYKRQAWLQGFDFEGMLECKLKAPWMPAIKNNLDVSNFMAYEGNDAIDNSYRDDAQLWVDFC